jgi:hypothetical protein
MWINRVATSLVSIQNIYNYVYVILARRYVSGTRFKNLAKLMAVVGSGQQGLIKTVMDYSV